MNVMNLFSGVQQINLRVTNMEQSTKWYQEIFGLSIMHDYGDTVVLRFEGHPQHTVICLIKLPAGECLPTNLENGTYPVFTLSPENADICRETLNNNGVEIISGGNKAHFTFKDPDGNLLEAYLPGLYEKEEFAHLR
jgi:catechol-2,3-dioxygenase